MSGHGDVGDGGPSQPLEVGVGDAHRHAVRSGLEHDPLVPAEREVGVHARSYRFPNGGIAPGSQSANVVAMSRPLIATSRVGSIAIMLDGAGRTPSFSLVSRPGGTTGGS